MNRDMVREIRKAIRGCDECRPYQKLRMLTLLSNPFIAALVAQAVEDRLHDEGVLLSAGGSRWDPESWDWDKVIERLKDLTLFVIEVIKMILPLFTR